MLPFLGVALAAGKVAGKLLKKTKIGSKVAGKLAAGAKSLFSGEHKAKRQEKKAQRKERKAAKKSGKAPVVKTAISGGTSQTVVEPSVNVGEPKSGLMGWIQANSTIAIAIGGGVVGLIILLVVMMKKKKR
jgi:hypothetical protein